jgi:hypothetical protein
MISSLGSSWGFLAFLGFRRQYIHLCCSLSSSGMSQAHVRLGSGRFVQIALNTAASFGG